MIPLISYNELIRAILSEKQSSITLSDLSTLTHMKKIRMLKHI